MQPETRRNEAERHPGKGGASRANGARYPLVVTGPDGLFEAVRDASEPVTRFFERMALGPFSLDDTRQAIQAPLEAVGGTLTVEEPLAEEVWRGTQGHPFFLTFLTCAMRDFVHEAMQRGWDRLGLSEVKGLWSQVADHLASERFAVDWQSATAAEREMLLTIARDAEDTPITRRIVRSGAALLPRLPRKGFGVRSGRGEYQLYHPLFRSDVLGRA